MAAAGVTELESETQTCFRMFPQCGDKPSIPEAKDVWVSVLFFGIPSSAPAAPCEKTTWLLCITDTIYIYCLRYYTFVSIHHFYLFKVERGTGIRRTNECPHVGRCKALWALFA